MTDVEICNLALGRAGITIFIGSLDEQSKEGRVMRMLFASVRDRVLEAFNWPFAKSEVDLQDIGAPPYGWEYRYRYPVDCIKPRLITIEGSKEPTTPIPFEKREDGSNLAIVCNVSPARLVYTKRVENIQLWPPLAASAFAWLLCAESVLPLSADAKLGQAANNAYQIAIREAANSSANGQRLDKKQTDNYVTERQ